MPKVIENKEVDETVATIKEVNMEEKVVVRSIAPWLTGVARIESVGDATIPALGTVRLTRNEIVAQVNNGNTLLTGSDGRGSHATWYIEDEYTRKECEFESIDGKQKQKILTKDVVKEMFEAKNIQAFQQLLDDSVITRAEKFTLVECINDKNLKINDYEKIMFAKDYLNLKM